MTFRSQSIYGDNKLTSASKKLIKKDGIFKGPPLKI